MCSGLFTGFSSSFSFSSGSELSAVSAGTAVEVVAPAILL